MRPQRLRFHDFELRPASGELFRDDQPIKLQQQPAKVLEVLARQAGEVVSRDELSRRVWGDDHHVDSEQGLNYCVRQIRIALGDQADDPGFVETVPRRGYRFVAPVRTIDAAEIEAANGEDGWAALVGPARRRATWWLAGLALGVVLIVGMRSTLNLGSRPATTGDPSPAAHEAFLQATYLAGKPLAVDRARALPLFERAIELAPGFAPAHAARALLLLALHRPPLEVLPLAEAGGERALALDPDLAAGHVVRGKVRMLLHHDGSGAEASFRRALELDPSSVEGHLGYAHLLSSLGRHDEALDLVRRAREIDPASALVAADLGWYYFFARRYAAAEKSSRETLEIERENVFALSCLVFTALERGDEAAALAFAREHAAAEVASRRDDPPAPEISTLEDYWRDRLRLFADWRRQGYYVSPTVDAIVHVTLGEEDRAFELLEEACREGSLSLLLHADRRFDPLRDDERFAHLGECARLD